jgi:hypothetical protein
MFTIATKTVNNLGIRNIKDLSDENLKTTVKEIKDKIIIKKIIYILKYSTL